MSEFFSAKDVSAFNRDGYIIVRGLATTAQCKAMARVTRASLKVPLAPLEFEADVQYPGSPTNRSAPGGNTPRRLLNACTRDAKFRQWATSPDVYERAGQLMKAERVMLSQNHHNCIMTKHPGFSSMTLWHQDIRYWKFAKAELVNVWLALGDETQENGGMMIIPGSHAMELSRSSFDGTSFFRTDINNNKKLIERAIPADLEQGDALFFHCRTLHAAGRNETKKVKLSVVFTYRDESNKPVEGTRSAAYPDIPCYPTK